MVMRQACPPGLALEWRPPQKILASTREGSSSCPSGEPQSRPGPESCPDWTLGLSGPSPGKDDCRARARAPSAWAVAEVLGETVRGSEALCLVWSSVAGSSPCLPWAGKTEGKTSSEEGSPASAGKWGGSSCVPTKDSLGSGELSGLIEVILVLRASWPVGWGAETCLDLGEVAATSSKKGAL